MTQPIPDSGINWMKEQCSICHIQFKPGDVAVHYDGCSKIHPLHEECHLKWYIGKYEVELTCVVCGQPWVEAKSVEIQIPGSETGKASSSSPASRCYRCQLMLSDDTTHYLDIEELDPESAHHYRVIQSVACPVCAALASHRGGDHAGGDDDYDAFL